MKPRPDEAQNTKVSLYERSLLIYQTTFEIFQFENWTHPVGPKTKMDFHVSLGFLALTNKCQWFVTIDSNPLSNTAVYNPLMIRLSRIFADLVINRDGQSFKRYLFGFNLELRRAQSLPL